MNPDHHSARARNGGGAAWAARISRRQLLAGGAGVLAVGALGARDTGRRKPGMPRLTGFSATSEALAVLGRTELRAPGSLPFPDLRAGTDTMPAIEHFVVLMMENHSYDNMLGALGRGDGYETDRRLATEWNPLGFVDTNPYADGRVQHAFRMPTTCQLSGTPSQEWSASHNAYDGGRMDGFVRTPIAIYSKETVGGVAMGYWDSSDLPFTYSLASNFPLCDRWFCSLLGQTDPNRRYLIAATSMGMTDDIGTSVGNGVPDTSLLLSPPNGTIFDSLSLHGIRWVDYAESFPSGATAELYPIDDAQNLTSMKSVDDFFTDAASGNLPGFCIIDMDYDTQSQENPQNIVVGESFMEQVVRAIGASPAWHKTLLVVTYDEHGGYYDHVPPPAALAPDLVPPLVQPGESVYDGFRRYGIRVPAIVVSPYAIPPRSASGDPQWVTHVVHDHTSILAMVERKWNLPALTYRDANANDLSDFLDMEALAAGRPTFPELPPLAASGMNASTLACSTRGPGLIPPDGSVSA